MPQSEYPPNWWEISYVRKADVKFRCERCGYPEDEETEDYLTVIILDHSRPYYKPGNLAVLCDSCRLHVINTTLDNLVNQLDMFGDFEIQWLEPHLKALGISVPALSVGTK